MNLFPHPTYQLHRTRTIFIVLLLGIFQGAFADKAFDSSVGKTSASQIDLSLPSEYSVEAENTARPDFSGIWVLDESASDDLREAARAAQKKGPKSGRGDRGSGGGRGGRGPGPGGGASSRNNGDDDMTFRSKKGKDVRAELSARRLEVVHQEPLLRITTERQGTREVYTDFRGASISAIGGMEQVVVTGGWEGEVLVIESTAANGDRTAQYIRLLERPLRLERISTLPGRSGNSQEIQIKQIFVPEGATTRKSGKGDGMEFNHLNWLED